MGGGELVGVCVWEREIKTEIKLETERVKNTAVLQFTEKKKRRQKNETSFISILYILTNRQYSPPYYHDRAHYGELISTKRFLDLLLDTDKTSVLVLLSMLDNYNRALCALSKVTYLWNYLGRTLIN